MNSATVWYFWVAVVASAWASGGVAVAPIVAPQVLSVPVYQTSYAVADAQTGDQKSAHETRTGEVTKGSYSFVQPDGVVRTVNYIVTPTGGFQAQVINTGVSPHPGNNKAVLGAPLKYTGVVNPGVASPIVQTAVPVAPAPAAYPIYNYNPYTLPYRIAAPVAAYRPYNLIPIRLGPAPGHYRGPVGIRFGGGLQAGLRIGDLGPAPGQYNGYNNKYYG